MDLDLLTHVQATGINGDHVKAKGNASTGAMLVEALNGRGETIAITRPANATQYAIRDVVGDTNGSAIFEITGLGRADGQFIVTVCDLILAVSALPTGMTAGFDVHFYSAAPTAIADNAAWDLLTEDRLKHQGKVTISIPVNVGSSCESLNDGFARQVTLSATGSLFVELVTLSAFTPTSGAVIYLNVRGIEV